MGFYERFYDYCNKIVQIWREKEKELFLNSNVEMTEDSFYTELAKYEDNDFKVEYFKGLASLKNEFVNHLIERGNVPCFEKYVKIQKNYTTLSVTNDYYSKGKRYEKLNINDLIRTLFAEDLFVFQFELGNSNDGIYEENNNQTYKFSSYIELPTFINIEKKEKVHSKGNEFLRVLKSFNKMPQNNNKKFFNIYCDYLISSWIKRAEETIVERKLNKKFRNEKLSDLKKIIRNTSFNNTNNKEFVLNMLCENNFKYHEKNGNEHPVDFIRKVIKEDGKHNTDEQIFKNLSALRIGIVFIREEVYKNQGNNSQKTDNKERESWTWEVPLNKFSPKDKLIMEYEEKEIKIKQKQVKKLIDNRYLKYVKIKNDPKKYKGLQIKIMEEIRRDIISMLFSFEYDVSEMSEDREKRLTQIDIRRNMKKELEKVYRQKYSKELDSVLPDETKHNILSEILENFKTKINQKTCRAENDKEEIDKLTKYVTRMMEYLSS